jgi:serine/threonine protein kinase
MMFVLDKKYQDLKAIGKGSYGVVCSASRSNARTGEKDRVAIKKVTPMCQHIEDSRHVLRELRLMRYMGRHQNVISLEDIYIRPRADELYIVMELLDSDLHKIIQSKQELTDVHFRYFFHQLLCGVKYLHMNRIIHRDLKPGNLLVSRDCRLRITDFGLARQRPKGRGCSPEENVDEPMTEHVVTRWYRAAELMLLPDGLYSYPVDMWACGCILAEMLGRRAVFPGKNFVHQLTLIFDIIGSPQDHEVANIRNGQARKFLDSQKGKRKVPFKTLYPSACDEVTQMLDTLLVFDPENRASADEALALPYMNKQGATKDPMSTVYPSTGPEFEFNFERSEYSNSDLRELIILEQMSFQSELLDAAASPVTQHQSALPTGPGPRSDPAAVVGGASAVRDTASDKSAHRNQIASQGSGGSREGGREGSLLHSHLTRVGVAGSLLDRAAQPCGDPNGLITNTNANFPRQTNMESTRRNDGKVNDESSNRGREGVYESGQSDEVAKENVPQRTSCSAAATPATNKQANTTLSYGQIRGQGLGHAEKDYYDEEGGKMPHGIMKTTSDISNTSNASTEVATIGAGAAEGTGSDGMRTRASKGSTDPQADSLLSAQPTRESRLREAIRTQHMYGSDGLDGHGHAGVERVTNGHDKISQLASPAAQCIQLIKRIISPQKKGNFFDDNMHGGAPVDLQGLTMDDHAVRMQMYVKTMDQCVTPSEGTCKGQARVAGDRNAGSELTKGQLSNLTGNQTTQPNKTQSLEANKSRRSFSAKSNSSKGASSKGASMKSTPFRASDRSGTREGDNMRLSSRGATEVAADLNRISASNAGSVASGGGGCWGGGRRRTLTVPKSPSFALMSWQRKKGN